MIEEVDETLRGLLRDEALKGSQVEVSFDAPTKEWAARRNAPVVNLYLYDIREDLSRRDAAWTPLRNEEGIVVGRGTPPRHYKLQYMLTAWTQRPEDEHRLISACLATLLRHETLAPSEMNGSLADQPLPAMVSTGLPLGPDRSIADVWSALGGELKPSLDVVITVPFVVGRSVGVGAPVREVPRISISRPAPNAAAPAGAGALAAGGSGAGAGGPGGADASSPGGGPAAAGGKRGKQAAAAGSAAAAASSAGGAASTAAGAPAGGTPAEQALSGGTTELAPRRPASGMTRKGPIRPEEPSDQDESFGAGADQSGRILRVRGFPRP